MVLMRVKMISINNFDSCFPVKTVISEQEDWIRNEGWRDDISRAAILEKYMKMPLRRVVYAKETHSGSICIIRREDPQESLAHIDERYSVKEPGGYDAVVTADPGILICLRTADCLPLFLYDKKNHVAAMAHNGWRGVCSGVAANTVDVMKKSFGTDPDSIVAAIGPCICGNCYEVGEELLDHFKGRFGQDELNGFFTKRSSGKSVSGESVSGGPDPDEISRDLPGIEKSDPEGSGQNKYSLDIRKAVIADLKKAGISAGNIFDTGICSFENRHFASYRRDGRVPPEKQTLTGIVLKYLIRHGSVGMSNIKAAKTDVYR